MQLYPAIDMKGGQCVRLRQGEFSDVTVYESEPFRVAIRFEQEGATFIHLVDLDGALEGKSINEDAIRKVVSSVKIPCELGGGIRTMDDIERVLSYGIYRVIIGTKAVSDPDFVTEAVKKFGADHIVVGVDAKNGLVATHGWEKVSEKSALEMVLDMKARGVKTVIYTDISKDGMLSGPNVDMTKKLATETGIEVIASGGMSCMEDLEKLKDAGIPGAIIGKAIYEKKIDVREAVSRYQKPSVLFDIPFSEMKKDPQGLVPVIVQEDGTGEVLMLAYMNEEAYENTLKTGLMTYYSRSRKEQWVKGLTSGHLQYVKELRIDCDRDTLLATVKQIGAACHTGNHSCFYTQLV